MEIFIPYNVPSLKNSKVKTVRGVFFSKTVRKYLQKLGVKNYHMQTKQIENYKKRINQFQAIVAGQFKGVGYPLELGFHFVRDTNRKFDYINAMQIIQDLLVAHGCIIDDDCDHLVPYVYKRNGKYYTVNKEDPGVHLRWKSLK